jgi:uncharacterized protein YhbP (UPF0306 family)
MNRDEFEKTVTDFMETYTTMTLACTRNNEPWAAAVFFARQGWELIFFSSPKSRHSEIFSENPNASAAIHGDYHKWQEIKGLQLEGTVERIKGPVAIARATATFIKRFPFVSEFFSDPETLSAGLAKKMAKVALYRFRPSSIRYLTNEERFGRRWRLVFRNGQPIGDLIQD